MLTQTGKCAKVATQCKLRSNAHHRRAHRGRRISSARQADSVAGQVISRFENLTLRLPCRMLRPSHRPHLLSHDACPKASAIRNFRRCISSFLSSLLPCMLFKRQGKTCLAPLGLAAQEDSGRDAQPGDSLACVWPTPSRDARLDLSCSGAGGRKVEILTTRALNALARAHPGRG